MDCLSNQNQLLRFKAAVTIVEKVGAMPEGLVYAEGTLHKQLQGEKIRELNDPKLARDRELSLSQC